MNNAPDRLMVLAMVFPVMSIEEMVDDKKLVVMAKHLGLQTISTCPAAVGVGMDPVMIGGLLVRSRKVIAPGPGRMNGGKETKLPLDTTAVVPSGVTAMSLRLGTKFKVDSTDSPETSKIWTDDELLLVTIALVLLSTILPIFVTPFRTGVAGADAPRNEFPLTVAVALATRSPKTVGTPEMENEPSL